MLSDQQLDQRILDQFVSFVDDCISNIIFFTADMPDGMLPSDNRFTSANFGSHAHGTSVAPRESQDPKRILPN